MDMCVVAGNCCVNICYDSASAKTARAIGVWKSHVRRGSLRELTLRRCVRRCAVDFGDGGDAAGSRNVLTQGIVVALALGVAVRRRSRILERLAVNQVARVPEEGRPSEGKFVKCDTNLMAEAVSAKEEEVQAMSEHDSCRIQRLKDMVLKKEFVSAITSSQFALKLSGAETPGSVDYIGLCARLARLTKELDQPIHNVDVISDDVRALMVERLSTTRFQLEQRLGAISFPANSSTSAPGNAVPRRPAKKTISTIYQATVEQSDITGFFSIFLRDDGTVDIDGEISESRGVAHLGRDLWERLNASSVSAPDRDTGLRDLRVVGKRTALVDATHRVSSAQRSRAAAREKFTEMVRTQGPLVEESVRARTELLGCEQARLEAQLVERLAQIDYLIEKCAVYFEAELHNFTSAGWDLSGPSFRQLVAKLSLLDEASRHLGKTCVLFESVDGLTLDVLCGQIAAFSEGFGIRLEERRLPALRPSGLWRFTSRYATQLQHVVLFYIGGTRLLWRDLRHAASLIWRCFAEGYTLTSRQGRTLRRLIKDLAMLFPVLVILVIPLSPMGHVMVFSFIQRFFPDFFPSPYTQRRQNATRVFEQIADDQSEAFKPDLVKARDADRAASQTIPR